MAHGTQRRYEILAYIEWYSEKYGNFPSTIKTARHFHFAQQTVYQHYVILMDEGRIARIDGEWVLIKTNEKDRKL